ncbi:cytochrome c3 family protein [Thiolapillus sp.]
MKSKTITIIVGLNLAALIVLAILYPEFMIAPGKTIDAHAEFSDDCFACHTPFIGSTPDKCIACHKVADIGIRTTTGLAIDKEKKSVAFHQKLREDDCVACHSDHKGVQAYRPIGQFSHTLLYPEMARECSSCHASPDDSLHRKTKGECSSCHDAESWVPATFDHDQYFVFDRDHDTECATCHINDNYSTYTCYGCHEHSRSKIRGEHVEEGIYEYENCVECHRSADEDEAERIWRSLRMEKGGFRGRGRGDRYEHDHDDDD